MEKDKEETGNFVVKFYKNMKNFIVGKHDKIMWEKTEKNKIGFPTYQQSTDIVNKLRKYAVEANKEVI